MTAGVPYPWDEWISWDEVQLVQGVDFSCQLDTFRVLAYVAARRLGRKVSVSISGDVVTLTRVRRPRSK